MAIFSKPLNESRAPLSNRSGKRRLCRQCGEPMTKEGCLYCDVHVQGLSDVFKAAGSANEIADYMSRIMPQVEDSLIEIKNTTANASLAIDDIRLSILSSASAFSDMCRKVDDSIVELKGFCVLLCACVMLALCYYYNFYFKEVAAMVCVLLTGLVLFKDLKKAVSSGYDAVMEAILNMTPLASVVTVQGNIDFSMNDFGNFASLFMTGASVLLLGALPGKNDINELMTRISKAPQTASGIHGIFVMMQKTWTYFEEFVQVNVCGDKDYVGTLSVMSSIADWSKQIDYYLDQNNRKLLRTDVSHANVVARLYAQGVKFSANRNIYNEVTKGYILTYYPKVTALVEECYKSGVLKSGARPEPLCVLLHGDSGCGKTSLLMPMVIDLALAAGAITVHEKNFGQIVFTRNVDNEFWDGYGNQFAVLIDEFAQKIDSPSNPNEQYAELINLVNTAPCHLHMAAIEDKSNSYFSSGLILMTSNISNISSVIKSIHTPSAVARRIAYSYRVYPREEYGENVRVGNTDVYRLNRNKIPKSDKVQTDLVWFLRCDPATGHAVTGEPESYDQVISILKRDIRDRIMSSDVTHKSHLDYLSQGGNNILVQGKTECEDVVEVPEHRNFVAEGRSISHDHAVLIEQADAVFSDAMSFPEFEFWAKLKKLKFKIRSIMNDNPRILKFLKGASMILGSIGLLSAFLKMIPKFSQVQGAGPSSHFGQDRHAKRNVAAKSVRLHKSAVLAKVETQGRMDSNTEDLLNSMENNIFLARVIESNAKHRLNMEPGVVIMVKDSFMLMPQHYFDLIPEDATVKFCGRSASRDFTITWKEMFNNAIGDPEQDYCLIDTKVKQKFKDITHHFIKDAAIQALRSCPGMLMTFERDRQGFLNRRLFMFPDVRIQYQSLRVAGKVFQEMEQSYAPIYYNRSYYCTYTALTRVGDCGGPIILNSTEHPNKILGTHWGGNNKSVGYGSVISQESLLSLMRDVVVQGKAEVEKFSWPIDEQKECDYLGDLCIGKVNRPVFRPIGSSIVPSPIYELITPAISKPAMLCPFEIDDTIIDPGKLALKKLIGPDNSKRFNWVWLDVAVNDVSNLINTNFNMDEVKIKYDRVLTYQEAITGIDGNCFMPGLKRGTSCGYNLMPYMVGPGKTTFIGENEYIFEGDGPILLRNKYDAMMSDIATGVRPFVPYADYLKDERRPIDKVDHGKTRIFSAACLEYNIAVRQYFLPFCAWIMHNRNFNDISVGTNVFSGDWELIARKLLRHGDKVVAGDFSNYDGSLSKIIVESVLTVIEQFYDGATDCDQIIRRGLWREISESVHIYGRDVYMCTHSNPSGNPLTTIINSIANAILMRYVYLDIMQGTTSCNMKSFNGNVSMVCYGDDNVLNISDDIIHLYNQHSIMRSFEKIGMTYTDELKGGTLEIFRHLHEIRYLKRYFVYIPFYGRHVAPLEVSVIDEMLNWVRKQGDPEELCSLNCETAEREYALHGKPLFQKKQAAMRKACAGFKTYPKFLSFEIHEWAIQQGKVVFEEDYDL